MIRRGQISELDCRTAESMVARYMNHTLKTDEMEEFLDHIEHCPSCYDELETYFIVNKETSSWMNRRTVLYWIFRSFWNRISAGPEEISIREGEYSLPEESLQ